MIIHIVRAIYLLVVLAFTVSYAFQDRVYLKGPTYVTLYILIPILAAFGLVMVDMFWRKKRLQALSGLFFGLLGGLVIAYVLAQIVTLTSGVFQPPLADRDQIDIGKQRPEPVVVVVVTSQPSVIRHVGSRYIVEPLGTTTYPANGPTKETSRKPADVLTEIKPTAARQSIVDLIKVLVGASAVFICVSFVLQTKDDFRFVIPYVEFARQSKGARPLLLDTSVIIDGRIADISETRILESQVVIPQFILVELQAIADSDDKLKRNRGRRGLDVLNRLRASDKIDIQILDARIASVESLEEVDAKLVALARHLDGRIVTNDYNLNKIAQLRGVDVININDLANALKPIVLPGESMSIKIIKPGEEAGQGVGYLEDGTMVVAEQGRDYIGREIVILVTSVLQTSAGRMIFGRLDPNKTFTQRDHKV